MIGSLEIYARQRISLKSFGAIHAQGLFVKTHNGSGMIGIARLRTREIRLRAMSDPSRR
jgi:hypothetical protein